MTPRRAGEFDYVVVGGGTAGCIVAARLAERAEATVCLIEAGEAFAHDPMVLGYHGSVPLLGDPRYDYDYAIVAQARGNSRIRQSRARMLGGCSSHNDSVAFLPPARDLREWERLGAAGWGPEATRPYFERAMAATHIHRARGRSECARAVHRAALAFGLPERDLHAGDFAEAAGWLYMNERDEVRQSTAVAYLYPLSALPRNLAVLPGTRVGRVLLDEGGGATGVTTSAGVVRAREEVILCAGAIDTPRLLMWSGIGPPDGLAAAGIAVRHELAGVGENLRDHLEVPVVFESARDTGPSLQNAENAFFGRSRPDVDGFDVFVHVITQPYYVPLHVDGRPIPMPDRGLCLVPNAAKPRSVGTVRLDPARPYGSPLIDPRYLTDRGGEDERVLRAGVRLAREVAAAGPLDEWIVREVAPGERCGDDDESLGRYVRQASNTVYHPAGTCRMGAADDAGAVVDPALRVRGLERLRIADASVFPQMISVNLCLTTMMVGERCAALVAGVDSPRRSSTVTPEQGRRMERGVVDALVVREGAGVVDDAQLAIEADEREEPVDRRGAADHGEPATGVADARGGPAEQVRAARVDELEPAEVEHDGLGFDPRPAQRAIQPADRGDVQLADDRDADGVGRGDAMAREGRHAVAREGESASFWSASRTRLFAVPTGIPSTSAACSIVRPPQ